MNKPTLLADIRRVHAELLAAADGLDDAAWLAEPPGMPGWTRKDVLAHCEYWSNNSARVLSELRAGREPYDRSAPSSVDELNARVLAENRDRSLDDVMAGEADSHMRVVAAVEAASDAELFEPGHFALFGDGAVAEVVEGDTTAHWPEHLPHLRAG